MRRWLSTWAFETNLTIRKLPLPILERHGTLTLTHSTHTHTHTHSARAHCTHTHMAHTHGTHTHTHTHTHTRHAHTRARARGTHTQHKQHQRRALYTVHTKQSSFLVCVVYFHNPAPTLFSIAPSFTIHRLPTNLTFSSASFVAGGYIAIGNINPF